MIKKTAQNSSICYSGYKFQIILNILCIILNTPSANLYQISPSPCDSIFELSLNCLLSSGFIDNSLIQDLTTFSLT